MNTEHVYLIHLDRPLSPAHTCQHYLGSAVDPWNRLEEHKAGRGARLLQVATQRGIGFRIVRTWQGGRQLERQLKDRHAGPELCPICSNERRRQRYQLSLWDLWLDEFTFDNLEELAF